MKLPIDFLRYVRNGKGYLKIILFLSLGVLLIVFGLSGRESSAGADTPSLSEEERVADFCSSLVGVGECRVLITYRTESDRYGKSTKDDILGIAVLCDGGDNITVKERVIDTLTSLYGIGANRIRVEKLKK